MWASSTDDLGDVAVKLAWQKAGDTYLVHAPLPFCLPSSVSSHCVWASSTDDLGDVAVKLGWRTAGNTYLGHPPVPFRLPSFVSSRWVCPPVVGAQGALELGEGVVPYRKRVRLVAVVLCDAGRVVRLVFAQGAVGARVGGLAFGWQVGLMEVGTMGVW
jgi:hypothetical protein